MKKLLSIFALLALVGCSSLTGEGGIFGSGDCDSKEARDFAAKADSRVFFAFDSSALSADARKSLDTQVAWLKKNSNINVVIEGHADERGTREYNLALGERRANAVKKYLISKGVKADRISTVSYGKERPEVLGSNEAAWAKNRRAVTVVKVQ